MQTIIKQRYLTDLLNINQDGGDRPDILDKIESDLFMREYKDSCKNMKNYVPAILPPVSRIVVIGDIHGDYNYAVRVLEMANVAKFYDNKIEWTGGKTIVVQVGDQIDRCRPVIGKSCKDPTTTLHDEASDIKILKLFNELNRQALKVGGSVISLLGNHEIINSLGQMDYVSYMGIDEFTNYKDPKNPDKKFASGLEARIHAFKTGNEFGTLLGCTRVPAVVIGSNLFVHAGVVDGLITEIGLRGIDDFELINMAIRKWLLGLIDVSNIASIINGSNYSMFWTRLLGSIPADTPMTNAVCENNISKVLKLFKVNGIIIGHTPQSFIHNHDINSTCDNKIWRVDTGSSSAFDQFDPHFMRTGSKAPARRYQYLEIINDTQYKICDESGCKKK